MQNPDPYTIHGRDGAACAPHLVGGKAHNLARLQKLGERVPAWFVVTTDAYRRTIAARGLAGQVEGLTTLHGGKDARLAAASEIGQSVAEAQLPEDVASAVARAHGTAFGHDAFVAVRSSAIDEDAAGESFAGLHDSFLFVRGTDGVLDALKRVWASLWGERAVAYRIERGLPLSDIAIAVVVQQMVYARASGVMFTVNPVTGNVREIAIDAVHGAGEGIVSGGLSADSFRVDKDALAVEVTKGEQEEHLVFDDDAGGGLRREPLSDELRAAPCLTNEQVREVARAGLRIERSCGRPQDIEFSYDERGVLFILQSRPVSTVDEYGPAAGNRQLWDNSNIIESYSGVTSPLTFSFIRRAYATVYRCFGEVMGIPQDQIEKNRSLADNMLGMFRGRVYYNLLNWYRLLRLFPGYGYNKSFMESMMGFRELAGSDDAAPAPTAAQRYFVELPALIRLVVRSTRNFARIDTHVRRFQEFFEDCLARWRALDLASLPVHELIALEREIEDTLFHNWRAPNINDFYVMVFYGSLKKLCATWCGDATGTLQNDLLCGEGGIDSTKPVEALIEIARYAAARADLRADLLARSADELARSIPGDARYPEFASRIAKYLELYGFRFMGELKLEEYSLRDRPAFVYQMIKNYLAGDEANLDLPERTRRERRIRGEAERRAFAAVRRQTGVVPRGWLFRWVLRNARRGVKNRENLRFARSRAYDLVRDVCRQIGRCLTAEGILDRADDVFYLTTDELRDYAGGTAVTTDLRSLAAVRAAEFDRYRRDEVAEPDDRFETFGLAYHRNRFRGRTPAQTRDREGGLSGTGCCPGRVTGPVKVLRSPTDDMNLSGEILVAGRTDPGWVPLYPAASGLLIERGSMLSHSAIVAREMGIPTIVGIPGLLRTLQTGQWVSMDGSAGTVDVVDPQV